MSLAYEPENGEKQQQQRNLVLPERRVEVGRMLTFLHTLLYYFTSWN